jgi:hypothetical protein
MLKAQLKEMEEVLKQREDILSERVSTSIDLHSSFICDDDDDAYPHI